MHGVIRVGQSRITLDVVLEYWRMGMSAEDIARGFDTLELADVHGALAYYFRHRAEIDGYLSQRAEEAEVLRQTIESANRVCLDALKTRMNAAEFKEMVAMLRLLNDEPENFRDQVSYLPL